jgi:lipoate-protein ligase B
VKRASLSLPFLPQLPCANEKEDMSGQVLGEFGLPGERREGATGVWIRGKQKKIASIGIAVSSWITYHGCALNVVNDLAGFSRIEPCGFPARVMTSMEAELGIRCPEMSDVKESFLRHFSRHFERQLII